jgi:hypothetical protein
MSSSNEKNAGCRRLIVSAKCKYNHIDKGVAPYGECRSWNKLSQHEPGGDERFAKQTEVSQHFSMNVFSSQRRAALSNLRVCKPSGHCVSRSKLICREGVDVQSESANAEQHMDCEVPGFRRMILTDAEAAALKPDTASHFSAGCGLSRCHVARTAYFEGFMNRVLFNRLLSHRLAGQWQRLGGYPAL